MGSKGFFKYSFDIDPMCVNVSQLEICFVAIHSNQLIHDNSVFGEFGLMVITRYPNNFVFFLHNMHNSFVLRFIFIFYCSFLINLSSKSNETCTPLESMQKTLNSFLVYFLQFFVLIVFPHFFPAVVVNVTQQQPKIQTIFRNI